MKIGLIRHFKVNNIQPKFMASKDFIEWVTSYDNADVIQNEINISNIEWNKCYSSNLSRAIKTAEVIYKGEIIKTEQLREVPIAPIFKTNIKLPHIFWSLCGRAAWLFSHKSQIEGKKETEKRIKDFFDNIGDEDDVNILIVCHAFFMYSFQKELLKRGFKGNIIKKPRNGTMYLFERYGGGISL